MYWGLKECGEKIFLPFSTFHAEEGERPTQ